MLSVVIPVGPGRTAQTALNSLLQQSPSAGWEVLLVGDGFQPEVAASFSGLPLTVLATDSAGGANAARNLGASQAVGDVFCFLDDDDAYAAGTVDKIAGLVLREPESRAWSLGASVITAQGANFSGRRPMLPESAIWKRNRAGGCSSMVLRAAAFWEAGSFDETMPAMQDWDLWLRLSRLAPIRGIHQAWVLYHAHQAPRISTNTDARYRGLQRLLEKHGPHWPRGVRAFHQSRLAALDYRAGQGGLGRILQPAAPLASLYFMAGACLRRKASR